MSFSVFTALLIFNGCSSTHPLLDESLSNFTNVYNDGEARYVGGELQLISQNNWFFSTKEIYEDFVLEAEVKMPETSEYSNSGIIFRGQIIDTDKGTQIIGYQVDIDPSDRKWTGGLYDQGRRKWLYPIHPTRSHPDEDFVTNFLGEWTKEQGEAYSHLTWNKIKIVCKGSDIKIFINDILTTHVKDVKDSKGVIAFQHHGSKAYRETRDKNNIVRFRAISIKKL
ncbi:hypothetical protein KUL152_30770 [Tenacibaculum sp. KUL152]|uniref:3-keto-disaccharide hydrolase n=1 Tax=Alteromonas sp. KUL106 TaxID=2480799 RepID=UPI0012E49ED1|nr:DUF1080 domain-containing protein [Alteromonas sp. KUL106]GFD79406.1 hypothetical protein KUL118_22680 [Tenacibaculum sp. KUL118]GFD90851.1 hypothetical protein KUL152_30770 [Tenacibaculum sp. KUL152]GFD97281.1 hypothetical protein KUL154_60140 [Alteromonas sp. KUL154]GFE02003.1 hypothetical protein KUL156_45950 [Alteromonas sp. KUL156]GFD68678.1 hypothetical protein KUL106_19410 [Alteromonas sp. KUL106]